MTYTKPPSPCLLRTLRRCIAPAAPDVASCSVRRPQTRCCCSSTQSRRTALVLTTSESSRFTRLSKNYNGYNLNASATRLPPNLLPFSKPRHSSTSVPAAATTISSSDSPPPPPAPAAPQSAPTPRRSLRRLLSAFIKGVLFAVLAIYPAADYFVNRMYTIMLVTGPSMSPLFNDESGGGTRPGSRQRSSHAGNEDDDGTRAVSEKDILTPNRVLIQMSGPRAAVRRGEIVAFWSPLDPERLVVKRIIGMEGDLVVPRGPSIVGTNVGGWRTEQRDPVFIPQGHLWMEGDHPEGDRKTLDSNTYGPVSRSLVVGKVMAVVWPWSRRAWIDARDWKGCSRVQRDAVKFELATMHSSY